MAIYIGRRPDSGFTRVPNQWARDPKLSTRAKGLLTYLLSHQDGYQLSLKQVIAENTDGRDAVYKTLGELVERGYLTRTQRRGERGKVGEVDYRVADAPQVTTASGFTASGESGSGGDQGKQDETAGGTASWDTGYGVTGSGGSDTKKTRVKKTKVLEDQNTISLSAPDDDAASSDASAQRERETEDASQQPKTHDPVTALLTDAGCPDAQIDHVREELTRRFDVRSNGWWWTVAREGDLPALVGEVLNTLQPPQHAMTNTEWKKTLSGEPDCPHGEAGGNVARESDGWMHCASCRRQAGWSSKDVQPRTEDTNNQHRSTGALRAEQALRVSAELDALPPADRRPRKARGYVPWREPKDQSEYDAPLY